MKSTPNSNCNIVALCNPLSEVENILTCERATNHNTNIQNIPKMSNTNLLPGHIIEQLAWKYVEDVYNGDTDFLNEAEGVIRWLAGASGAASPQWRSVDDELPKESERVLCLMKSNGAIVSGYITKRWHDYPEVSTDTDFHFEDYGGYECTHWMPIPGVELNPLKS